MTRAPANDRGGSEAQSLWWVLTALVLLRAILAFVPWMGLWGLGIQRFLSPLEAWLPWTMAAAACVPALAGKAAPVWSRLGEALRERPAMALMIASLAVAALVWLLPDRVMWVGDSILRLGNVRSGQAPEIISPQAAPLDVWLHYRLPHVLVSGNWLDPESSVRLVGAIEAAGLSALAGAFALALEASAAGRAAAMAAVLFGGALCVMTGESKAFAEIVLAVVAVAALGLRALRGSGGSLIGLGAVVAAALLAHRLAIGLLPAWLFVCIFGLARGARERRPPWPAVLALALPAATMTLLAGKLSRTLISYDVPRNFLPAGGGLGALFSPTRLLDLLSALVMLAPLAFVIPVLWPAKALLLQERSPGDARADARTSWRFLLVLAAPFLLVALLARPPQGLIRDWDGLAAAGVALSLLAAWEIARVLRAPGHAWLAVPVTAVAATFTLSWLLHYHDPAQAVRRVQALLLEAPPRPPAERSRAWEFLAWHESRRERWDAAAQAFDSASALGPTPRMLAQWAMAETMRKNYPQARALYQRAVARDSNFTIGWTGVAISAIWFEDWDDCELAARQLQRLAPRDPKTLEIVAYLAQVRRTPPPPGR